MSNLIGPERDYAPKLGGFIASVLAVAAVQDRAADRTPLSPSPQPPYEFTSLQKQAWRGYVSRGISPADATAKVNRLLRSRA